MSRKRYTPEQIIGMLREAEVGLAQDADSVDTHNVANFLQIESPLRVLGPVVNHRGNPMPGIPGRLLDPKPSCAPSPRDHANGFFIPRRFSHPQLSQPNSLTLWITLVEHGVGQPVDLNRGVQCTPGLSSWRCGRARQATDST